MARVVDNAGAPPLGFPPIMSAVCRLLGCGSCLCRRREGRLTSRNSASRYHVTSSSPPVLVSQNIGHVNGQLPVLHSSPSVRIQVAGARSSVEKPETSVLLPKKALDQSFSGSPELPKPTPPKGFKFIDDSDLNADHCPTCLDSYTPDNPKIMTQCNHHFHLACIYEWMHRSRACPVCSKPMLDALGNSFA